VHLAGSEESNRPSRETARQVDVRQKASYVGWFAPGEAKEVFVNGVRVVIRLISRKGRRSRILIETSPGAEFRDC
jgi:hypothetical protein